MTENRLTHKNSDSPGATKHRRGIVAVLQLSNQ